MIEWPSSPRIMVSLGGRKVGCTVGHIPATSDNGVSCRLNIIGVGMVLVRRVSLSGDIFPRLGIPRLIGPQFLGESTDENRG